VVSYRATLFLFLQSIEIELRVTNKVVDMEQRTSNLTNRKMACRKRSLLYKHSDDLRQEMFAIEFVKACDTILKSCGLDLKLITFRCISVGKNQGFIEWVHGSVPLSELSHAFADSIFGSQKYGGSAKAATGNANADADDDEDEQSSVAPAGLTKYETLQRWNSDVAGQGGSGKLPNNPIQDYLRSFAYDPDAPYMIRKEAMATYVKSCAGYSAITYILGVGDRHLDNLLLHQTGHFFHCDYSFILGNDPKKYLPVRMSEDMVNGMGGRNSDNFIMFLSLTCAAFLTLRRPENVRYLLSMVRMMEGCALPDVETNQTIEAAILGIRKRLRLDLSEDEAITFMEKLIEDSFSSKMWLAVDAIHTFGKQF
jgi:phosphatidylinositol kinase/protein kinase (PI-3  family)